MKRQLCFFLDHIVSGGDLNAVLTTEWETSVADCCTFVVIIDFVLEVFINEDLDHEQLR